MKVLTVKQPWSWAIIHGPKLIENRSWPTDYRGPLLIHAGKSRTALGDEEDLLPDLPPYNQLIYGAIIGQVLLTGCVSVEEVEGEPFAEGPWCWILSEPQALLKPFYCPGALSLWASPRGLVF